MKEILISLIMPLYNAEKYVAESISSILTQKFANFELIVVDDGSSDKSLSIVKKIAKEDDRVRIFCNEHQGAAVARNLGIAESRGIFLFFVDSDDLFKKEMLSNLYTKAVLTNADVIISGFRKFDNQSGKTIWEFRPDGKFLIEQRIETKTIPNCLFEVVPPSPWGKLIKRELIVNNKINFQNLSSCNDFAFTYTVLSYCKTIAFCPDVLLYYRANTGSNISANRGTKSTNIIKAIKQLEMNLKESGKFDELKKTFIYRSKTSLNFELKQCNEREKELLLENAKQYLEKDLFHMIME